MWVLTTGESTATQRNPSPQSEPTLPPLNTLSSVSNTCCLKCESQLLWRITFLKLIFQQADKCNPTSIWDSNIHHVCPEQDTFKDQFVKPHIQKDSLLFKNDTKAALLFDCVAKDITNLWMWAPVRDPDMYLYQWGLSFTHHQLATAEEPH